MLLCVGESVIFNAAPDITFGGVVDDNNITVQRV